MEPSPSPGSRPSPRRSRSEPKPCKFARWTRFFPNKNSPEFPTVPSLGGPDPQAGESVCDLNLHVLTRRDWLVVEEPGDAGRRLGNQRDFHPDHLVVAEDQPVVVVLGEFQPWGSTNT